jgi:tetratricopeptide (TPR) repeat protein
MGLGQVYAQINNYEKALNSFRKVIEINSSYSPAYMALGDIYFQTRNEEKSVLSYRKVIELNPKSPDAYQRLALILAEQPKSHDEAFKMATKSVELAPKNPFSLDAIGWVSVQRGDIKGGLEKLKEASTLQPRDPVILYHLGIGHYKNNSPNEAKNALQAALNISKNFRGADQAAELLKKLSK